MTTILESREGDQYEVEIEVAKMCITLNNLIIDAGTTNKIPLSEVSTNILGKIIEYCKYHYEHPTIGPDDETDTEKETRLKSIREWDEQFCQVDTETLFQIILAANYLEHQDIIDLGCKAVAGMIKGKTPEEIRVYFNIPNDFTAEEEAKLAEENDFCEN